jgi:hypothetical protein
MEPTKTGTTLNQDRDRATKFICSIFFGTLIYRYVLRRTFQQGKQVLVLVEVHRLIFGTITTLDLATELLNCLFIGQSNPKIWQKDIFFGTILYWYILGTIEQ